MSGKQKLERRSDSLVTRPKPYFPCLIKHQAGTSPLSGGGSGGGAFGGLGRGIFCPSFREPL